MEALFVDSVECDDTQSSISIVGLPKRSHSQARLFQLLAEGDVFVDMIIQNFGSADRCDLVFTVPRHQMAAALKITEALGNELGASVLHREKIAKLSVSGIGLRSHTDMAVKMFRALAASEINVLMLNTSEIRVNVVVDSQVAQAGLNCLRLEFGLSAPGS